MVMITWLQNPTIQFYVDATFKAHLDSMCHDAVNDFDFVIIVAGNGEVRIGKTVMAIHVATYLAQKLGRKFDTENIVFSGEELRKQALSNDPSVFIYDEARAELNSKKWARIITQTLLDFFAECGKLNHIVILVLPDFFELPVGIATSRSECLINVYLERNPISTPDGDILTRHRGQYAFFTKKLKKILYFKGKKDFHNYNVIKPAFLGKFSNVWLIDRAAYEKKKDEFIRRNRETIEPLQKSPMIERFKQHRNILIKYLSDNKLSTRKIEVILNQTPHHICQSEISHLLIQMRGREKGQTPDSHY